MIQLSPLGGADSRRSGIDPGAQCSGVILRPSANRLFCGGGGVVVAWGSTPNLSRMAGDSGRETGSLGKNR